jgi:hypothetical protein
VPSSNALERQYVGLVEELGCLKKGKSMHAESGPGFADCALDSVRARLSVSTISADVTDETAAHRP